MTQLSNYGVIVQARANSKRLPGKILMDVEGKPMLLRQLQRLRHKLSIEKLLVATSTENSDDAVEKLCVDNGFNCFRGPLDDVVQRFILAANYHDIDYIIRVGGDDPLIDPECCNYLVDMHRIEAYDFMYASNRGGWPYGCAAELVSKTALEEIHKKVSDPIYLEHTVPYFFDFPELFKIKKVRAPEELNRPEYYFTVDYKEDLVLIRKIFKNFENTGEFFSLKEVIEFIDKNPELRNINKHLHNGFDH